MSVFVEELSDKVTSVGLTVTVYGGFFDAGCSVFFGDVEAPVRNFEDYAIEVIVPDIDDGEYDVSVVDSNGDSYEVGSVNVGEISDIGDFNFVKDYDEEDFEEFVIGMFPKGQVFDFEKGSAFRKLSYAIALSLLYLWSLVRSMMKALDPMHTDNLDDWEADLGLPEAGLVIDEPEMRRREIWRLYGNEGGCCESYFVHLCALFKVSPNFYEYYKNPEEFENIEFGRDDPNFYFKIKSDVMLGEVEYMYCDGYCTDSLLDFGDTNYEKMLQRVKPSHTKLILEYEVDDAENND